MLLLYYYSKARTDSRQFFKFATFIKYLKQKQIVLNSDKHILRAKNNTQRKRHYNVVLLKLFQFKKLYHNFNN